MKVNFLSQIRHPSKRSEANPSISPAITTARSGFPIAQLDDALAIGPTISTIDRQAMKQIVHNLRTKSLVGFKRSMTSVV